MKTTHMKITSLILIETSLSWSMVVICGLFKQMVTLVTVYFNDAAI